MWNIKAAERKKEIIKKVKESIRDVKILGDFLRASMKKCYFEHIPKKRKENIPLYREGVYKKKFIVKIPIQGTNKQVIDISSKILENLFPFNIFEKESFKVIDVENNQENTISYLDNPIKYILGLYYQHIGTLEDFSWNLEQYFETEENFTFPTSRSEFFSLVLITMTIMFQNLKPWRKSLVFLDFFVSRKDENERYSSIMNKFNIYFLKELLYPLIDLTSKNKRERFNFLISIYKTCKDDENLSKFWSKMENTYANDIMKLINDRDAIEKDFKKKAYNLTEEQYILREKYAKTLLIVNISTLGRMTF